MTAPLCVLIIMVALLYAQHRHYDFLMEIRVKEELILSDAKIKEFEELKRRVDALSIRAGLK